MKPPSPSGLRDYVIGAFYPTWPENVKLNLYLREYVIWGIHVIVKYQFNMRDFVNSTFFFSWNVVKWNGLNEVTESRNLRCRHRNKNISSLAFHDMRDAYYVIFCHPKNTRFL